MTARLSPPINDNPVVNRDDTPIKPGVRFSRAWSEHFQKMSDRVVSDVWFAEMMEAWWAGLPTSTPAGSGKPWKNSGALDWTP